MSTWKDTYSVVAEGSVLLMSIRSSCLMVLFISLIFLYFRVLKIPKYDDGFLCFSSFMHFCFILIYFKALLLEEHVFLFVLLKERLRVTGVRVSLWTRGKVQTCNKKSSDWFGQTLCSMRPCGVPEPGHLISHWADCRWRRYNETSLSISIRGTCRAWWPLLKETLKRSLWAWQERVWPSSYMNHHPNFIPWEWKLCVKY